MLKTLGSFGFSRRCLSLSAAEAASNSINAWQVHSFGGIEELQLSSRRAPFIASPTDVVVQVEAASVNPIDVIMTQGYGSAIFNAVKCGQPELPLTLGRDFAGKVLNKGMAVGHHLNVGDSVYGLVPLHKPGTHAETTVTDESLVLLRPSFLTAVESCSMLYTAMTAWSALWVTGDLLLTGSMHKKVLVLGASGGVGTAAVQMLKANGAFVVGTCSTEAVPLVEKLGADHVLDYKSPEYLQDVAACCDRFDIILDCAKFGIDSVPNNWNYSKYITLNSPLMANTDKYGLIPGAVKSALSLAQANAKMLPNGRSLRWAYFMPLRTGLEFVDKMIQSKQLSPVIDEVFDFSDTPKAYARVRDGHLRGKVVIDMLPKNE